MARWNGSVFVDFGTFSNDTDGNRVMATIPVDPTGVDSAQPDTRTVRMTYDGMGQLIHITDALNKVTDFEYDALGHRVLVRDADHPTRNVTTFDYDELDRLIATNASGLVTEFGYDAAGNVTRVEDPTQQVTGQGTIYSYDALSRLLSVSPPFSGTAAGYSYDARGRLKRITNARGNALEHIYEAWGGLKQVDTYNTVADANTGNDRQRRASYTYDYNGNPLTTSDDTLTWLPGGLLYTFTYDALNRVDTATAHYIPGGDRQLDSDHNESGNRTHLNVVTQLAGGGTADPLAHEWRFDERNRLDQAVFPSGADPTIAIASWESDDVRTLTHGNGATSQYRYDARGPVDTITVANTSTQLHNEPPRVYRRLHSLRGWSHEQAESVFTRSS